MHKYLLLLLVQFIFLICLLCPFAYAQKTITVATGSWPPWTGKNLENNGFVCHIVKKAFQDQGYKVEFKFYPWERAYTLLEQGEVQACAYRYKSKKAQKKSYYSDPVTKEQIVFFYKKSNPMHKWKELNDLAEYKIGVSRGNTYTDKFWTLAEKGVLNIDRSDNDLINFRKLLHGRIDIFPATKSVGYYLLKNNFPENKTKKITHSKKPLAKKYGYIAFPKVREDSNSLLQAFNQGLKNLKNKGLYDKWLQNMLHSK